MKKLLALAVIAVVWTVVKVITVIDDMVVLYDEDDWSDDE